RVGGGGGRGHQAVRLHALLAGPGPGWSLFAVRSLLPLVEGAARGVRAALHHVRRRDQPSHARLRRADGDRRAQRPRPRRAGSTRAGPGRRLQAQRVRHARLAGAGDHRHAARQGRAGGLPRPPCAGHHRERRDPRVAPRRARGGIRSRPRADGARGLRLGRHRERGAGDHRHAQRHRGRARRGPRDPPVGADLVAGGLLAAARISAGFLLVAVAYVVLLTAYSAWLKHVVIVDVLTVALGFVLRALGGTLAIDVAVSGWLLICTILSALFLALGKRRNEYLTLEADAARHRPILAEYSAGLLDQMIAVVTASTVTAYALYTMPPETVAKFHTQLLPATLPFVLYGIFRYLYLLYRRQLGGNPSELFLNDGPLLVNTLLWILAVALIIYGPRVHPPGLG